MHGYRGKIKGSHGIYVTSPLWQLYHSPGSYTMAGQLYHRKVQVKYYVP